MNVQVQSLTYDVASMVEIKEFVVNFEQKEWFGTTSKLEMWYLGSYAVPRICLPMGKGYKTPLTMVKAMILAPLVAFQSSAIFS